MPSEYEAAGSGVENPMDQATEAVQEVQNQPTETVEKTGEQPESGPESNVDIDPQKLQADYKSLQEEFRQRNEREKDIKQRYEQMTSKLQQYGGLDTIEQTAQWLNQNQKMIQEMVQKQSLGNIPGLDLQNADEETQKAIDTVRKIVDAVTDQKLESRLSEILKTQVNPLQEILKEKSLNENLKTLESKYDNFGDMREAMADLLEKAPSNIKDNPSLDDLDDLYWKAMRQTGKMEEYMAKVYNQRLEAKKKNSVDKPGTPAPKGGKPKLEGSMDEMMRAAYEHAKQETGLSF